MKTTVWKSFLFWFPICALAFINGAVREMWYKPLVGDLAAHQISTVSMIVVFTFYVWWVIRRWKLASAARAWTVGVVWLVMTLAFEFGVGHFVFGAPWSKLFHDYDLSAGRVWVFIPLWGALAPYAFYRWRKTEA